MRLGTVSTAALLAAAAVLSGCAVHVHDDRVALDETHCKVACPARGEASAQCAAPKVAACACEPAPVATCTAARGS